MSGRSPARRQLRPLPCGVRPDLGASGADPGAGDRGRPRAWRAGRGDIRVLTQPRDRASAGTRGRRHARAHLPRARRAGPLEPQARPRRPGRDRVPGPVSAAAPAPSVARPAHDRHARDLRGAVPPACCRGRRAQRWSTRSGCYRRLQAVLRLSIRDRFDAEGRPGGCARRWCAPAAPGRGGARSPSASPSLRQRSWPPSARCARSSTAPLSGPASPARPKGPNSARAIRQEDQVTQGDRQALDSTCPADGGGRIRLADLAGKPLVLYFYPKDDTSGCTSEALDFAAAYPAFRAAGVEVVGVSKDSVQPRQVQGQVQPAFPLASDESRHGGRGLGVWVEKSMYGSRYMGIERSTFLSTEPAMPRRNVKVLGQELRLDQTAAHVVHGSALPCSRKIRARMAATSPASASASRGTSSERHHLDPAPERRIAGSTARARVQRLVLPGLRGLQLIALEIVGRAGDRTSLPDGRSLVSISYRRPSPSTAPRVDSRCPRPLVASGSAWRLRAGDPRARRTRRSDRGRSRGLARGCRACPGPGPRSAARTPPCWGVARSSCARTRRRG